MVLRFKLDIEYSKKWLAVYVSSEYTAYLYSYKNPIKPGNGSLKSMGPFVQAHQCVRCIDYSVALTKIYLCWV
jgi:hypothetical protein